MSAQKPPQSVNLEGDQGSQTPFQLEVEILAGFDVVVGSEETDVGFFVSSATQIRGTLARITCYSQNFIVHTNLIKSWILNMMSRHD